MDRRRFLGAIAGGTALLAGCGATPSQPTPKELEGYPLPSVNGTLSGWSKAGTQPLKFKKSVSVTDVVGYGRTQMFSNSELRKTVKDKTLGQFDQRLSMFFASQISLKGYLNSAATAAQAAGPVKSSLRRQLEDQGIRNVSETTPREPTPSVSKELVGFRGDYPLPELQREVTIPDVGQRTLTIPGGTLSVEGFASIWKPDRDTVLVGGGIYPGENYERAGVISVSGDGKGDGIDLTVTIDLGLQPSQMHRNIVGLVESISKTPLQDSSSS